MQKQLLLGWQFLVLCCDGPWGNGFRLQEGRSGLELDREAFRDPFQLRPFCDSAVVFLLYPTRCPSSPPSQPAVPSRGSSPMLAALLHPFPPLSGHPTAPQWGYPPPTPPRPGRFLSADTEQSPLAPRIPSTCPYFNQVSIYSPQHFLAPCPALRAKAINHPPPPAPIPSSRASIGEAPCPFVPHSVTR